MNKIGSNLGNISGEMTLANRLLTLIKKERLKNKLLLYGVILFLVVSLGIIIYNFLF